MPRNVRNWWIKSDVDGRKSDFASGPRNKLGGFSTCIYQRVDGTVQKVVTIDGIASPDGKLKLIIDVNHPPNVEVDSNLRGSDYEYPFDYLEIKSKR